MCLATVLGFHRVLCLIWVFVVLCGGFFVACFFGAKGLEGFLILAKPVSQFSIFKCRGLFKMRNHGCFMGTQKLLFYMALLV